MRARLSEYDRASVAVNVVLSEIQRDTLRALCDTFVPSLNVPGDLTEFYARSASDLGVPEAVEAALGASVPEDQLAGLRGLLDAIAAQGFADAPAPGREAIVRGFMEAGPEALAGMSAFKGLALMLFYGMPNAQTGRNPNWDAIGYPGRCRRRPTCPSPSPSSRRRRTRWCSTPTCAWSGRARAAA